MRAEVKIQDGIEPYAVIYTAKITDEVQRILDFMNADVDTIIGTAADRRYVIARDEIIKVTVQDDHTCLHTAKGCFLSGKRLYEVKGMLGGAFVQISKSVIVRISACESVESNFGGMLLLNLSDGSREYVSRHYLPAFKKSIGL